MSREMIDLVWERTCQNLPDKMPAEHLYMALPFYMEYETKYDKKEKYHDIVDRLERAKEYAACAEASYEDRAWYLMTLIDVMENMSIEIYEQYRKLQDIFKQVLKEILACTDNGEKLPLSVGVQISYVILKACRTNVLLKEKYEPVGVSLFKRLLQEEPGSAARAGVTGMIFRACLPYLEP